MRSDGHQLIKLKLNNNHAESLGFCTGDLTLTFKFMKKLIFEKNPIWWSEYLVFKFILYLN